jgi:beta-N-acetylhexosaminidase
MTVWRAVTAVLGALLLAASCTPGGDAGSQAEHASASTRSSVSPDPAARPDSSAPPEPYASPDPSERSGAGQDQRPRRSARQGRLAAGLAGGWGPDARTLRRAEREARRLSLRKLAGQVIVAEYAGRQAPTSLVDDLHLGGVIVMRGNIGSTADLRRSNRRLQAAAREAGRRWPVFIGVDQEGGIVERVKGSATRFPAFMSAGAARDTRLTRRAAAASGAELRNLGFSVVFAPDGDVTSGPQDPTIGSRSVGSRPKLVAKHMNAAVDGYLTAGILPVVKHFPGHGSVPADSHVSLPVQTKTLRQLRRSDLVPFAAGVERGVPSVMAAHIDVRAVDPGTPSTLSRPVVTGLLRRDLGFRGLVVTDAMNMGAVAARHATGEAAVRALEAGNDVVLMPPHPAAARDGIVRAVRSGRLSRARLEQAAARQIAALLHQRDLEPALTRKPGTSRPASYRLSAGAATVASGACRGRLVGPAVRASGPSDAVARFNAAARQAGLRTGSGTSIALIGYGGGGRSADVVVTLDTPYALGRSSARLAKVAMYGDTPGAMRALVNVLVGKARAPGRLPVPVSGVQRNGC